MEKKIFGKEKITIEDFLIEFQGIFLDGVSNIQEKIELYLKNNKPSFIIIDEKIDQALIDDLEKSIGLHGPDFIHVGSAITYKEKTSDNVVFVSNDYEIIKKGRFIFASYGVNCVDPLYAIYHI